MLDKSTGFVVVVEGCDRTGKTTFCEYLSRFLHWPIVKFSQPVGDAITEYTQALAQHPESFIADRLHLGESVYGPIYRGTKPIDRSTFEAFEGDLAKRGALVVLMTDTPERIRARFVSCGEDFAKGDHVAEIVDRFNDEFARSALPKLRMNMALGTQMEKVVHTAAIINFLAEVV